MTISQEQAAARLTEPGRPNDPNPASTGRFTSPANPLPVNNSNVELKGWVWYVPSTPVGKVSTAQAALKPGIDFSTL